MDTGRTVNTRTLVVFGVIAIVLLGLVVLGVVWAKNRANQIASGGNQPDQTQPVQNNTPAPQPTAPNSVAGNQTNNNSSNNAAANTSTPQTGNHSVPAAGATDVMLLVGSVAAASFMGAKYLQTRRRLFDYR